MTVHQQQLSETVDGLLQQREIVREAQGEMREAKESLARKRKIYEEEVEKLHGMMDELRELREGRTYLPFSGHEPEGTPALNFVAAAQAQEKLKDSKSLNSNLSILIAYGLTESIVTAIMDSDLKISTVRQLTDFMRTPGWQKKIPGLGAKKVAKVEAAVQKFLDEAENRNPAEPPDNRMKKCGVPTCAEFYSRELEKCPKCGETVFELTHPGGDVEGESEFGEDFVDSTEVAEDDADVLAMVHVVTHPDSGLYHSSYSIQFRDGSDVLPGVEVVGRKVPHHASQPFETKDAAIENACVEAASRLLELELDSTSASVRQFANGLAPVQPVHTRDEHDESDDQEEDEHAEPVDFSSEVAV